MTIDMALTNFYASLVRRKAKKMEDVPERIQSAVQNRIEELGPLQEDDEIYTPVDNESNEEDDET